MKIKIGGKIKESRVKNNVTQEKFAEYLGVTAQAVSRWENGTCYPDVDLFPAIANFFGITIDELFESDRTEERRKKLSKEIYWKNVHGYIDEAISLAREAIKEFPNDFNIMHELLNVLYDKDAKTFKDEILSLCDRILEDCSDDSLRPNAIQIKALTYFKNGEDEKAKKTLNKLSNIYACENVMLPVITRGEEKVFYRMKEIFYVCDILSTAIGKFAVESYDFLESTETLPKEKQKLLIYEKVIKILEIVFDDGNLGFFNYRAAHCYESMARICIILNEYDNALGHLEKMANHCISLEKCTDDESNFTAILVSKVPNPPGYTHDKPSNMTYDMINDNLLKEDIYAPVREHPRFKAVIETLTPYAKSEQYSI